MPLFPHNVTSPQAPISTTCLSCPHRTQSHHEEIDSSTTLLILYIVILQGNIWFGRKPGGFSRCHFQWPSWAWKRRPGHMLPHPLWPDFHGKELENRSQKWPVSMVVAIMGQVCRIHSGSALRPHLRSLNNAIMHCLVLFSRALPFSYITLKLIFCTTSG